MGNNQLEREYEEIRLKQTISLAEEQLKQAKEAAEKKKSQIIEVKKEVRENAAHGVTNLYTSDGFEAAAGASHQNQCPARRCGRRPGRCTASGSRIFHTAG